MFPFLLITTYHIRFYLGRQLYVLPPFNGGGYYGDFDIKGLNTFARVREIVVIVIIMITVRQRCV